jgi:hypothetical protein
MECRLAGETEVLGETCSSATFAHHKIPHDQTRVWTRAAAVGSRRLTAWAMARPSDTGLQRFYSTGTINNAGFTSRASTSSISNELAILCYTGIISYSELHFYASTRVSPNSALLLAMYVTHSLYFSTSRSNFWGTLHTDFKIPLIQNVIQGRKRHHRRRIEAHTNPLMEPLLQVHKNRRLVRVWPTDL